MARVENSLAQFSFDASHEFRRLKSLSLEKRSRELIQNFRAYENEVLKDRPVSINYSYWFDMQGGLYNDSGKTPGDLTINGFNPQERNGLVINGFKKVSRLLYENPDTVVLWYSPPGKASFDDDSENPYSEIAFDYGQLYIQYAEQDQVNAVAVKITHEAVLRHFMPHIVAGAGTLKTEKEKIQYYLTRPSNTGLSLEEFLSINRGDDFVHRNHQGEYFHLRQVMDMVRQTLGQQEVPPEDNEIVVFAEKVAQAPITEEFLTKAYLFRVSQELKRTGQSSMSLSGSCGGRTVTGSEIENLLGLSNVFSSEFRLSTQTKEGNHFPDYNCPHCGKILTGESKKDQSSWRTECDYCQGKLNC